MSPRANTPPATQRKDGPAKSRGASRKSPLRRLLRAAMTAFCIAVALCLIVTGYAGYISPLTHNSLWGVLPLLFPIVFWVCVVTGIIGLFVFRRATYIMTAAMIICLGAVLDYCPVHFTSPEVAPDTETFTLQSYNCWGMKLRDGNHRGYNPQVSEIIATNADIVCLQEGYGLYINSRHDVTAAQMDTIHRLYPHISFGGCDGAQVLLSKYEIEPIHLDVTKKTFPDGDLAAYRVTLPSGRRITLFNVHLQSMHIKSDDVKTDSINPGDIRKVTNKLRNAAKGRARECNKIVQWIRQYGGPDVIVCGDFNDVQGCYTLHTLEDYGFKSAYTSTGLGPMITYNANRLYFRIDHVMYRGDLKALKMTKSDVKYSDHYPVCVEFAVTR